MDYHPNISAILNITPDHLNRHGTMENYIEIKERIAANQTEQDWIVLNYEDIALREFGENGGLKAKVTFFSSRRPLAEGLYLDKSQIIYAHGGKKDVVVDVNQIHLLGRHNYENVMAAAAIAIRMGVPLDVINRVVREFKAVEHRIEFVLERAGVRYYNDSKGTNPDAAIQAIRAMPGPTVLIAGGYDKHIPYDVLGPEIVEHVRALLLTGDTAEKIKAAVLAASGDRAGELEIVDCADLAQAVERARALARPGDVVILSPASASFDRFKNFE